MYEKQKRNERKTKTNETNDKWANTKKVGDYLGKNGLVISKYISKLFEVSYLI